MQEFIELIKIKLKNVVILKKPKPLMKNHNE